MNSVDLRIQTTNGILTKNSIKAFLFDLDGTLIDSLDLHIEAFQWILDKLGKDIDKEDLEPLMGKTPQDIIKQFFDDMNREELLAAATQKEEKLAEIIESVYVYPGVKEFLKQLQLLKIKTIVISSTHRRLVEILLDRAGLLDYLTDIVSGDEVKNGKPDAEPFRKGIEKSGVLPQETISIGDSIHDLKSATAANSHFIGILTGKTDEARFKNEGLTLLVNSIDDIQLVHDEI